MTTIGRVTRADFALLEGTRSRREHGRLFLLASVPLSSRGSVKATCVVSKKIALKAVDRNRIKRRARTALRAALIVHFSPNILVLYAKRAARAASYAEMETDIRELVRQVGVR